MARYISKARRRRRAVIAVAIGATLAFAAGLLIGRQMTSSVDDRVSAVRDSAADVATGLERLDIEYQQVLDGTDSLQSGVLTPIDDLRHDLQTTMDRAPWLRPAQRSTVLDAVAQVQASAEVHDPLVAFTGHLHDAAESVRATFGITA